jgi:hypothetical protein
LVPVALADEEDRADVVAVGGRRHRDRDEGAAGLHDRGRTGEHVTADRVEDDVGLSDGILEPFLVEVDEAVGPQVEHERPDVAPTGPDDPSVGRAGELHRSGPDAAAGAVDDRGLARGQLAVVEQRLPRGDPGLGDRGRLHVVDRLRLRRQIASFDRDVLGGPAVAIPVDEPEDLVADPHTGCAVAERDDDAGPFVSGDERRAVTACFVGEERPGQLGGGEAGSLHLDEGVADGRLGVRRVFVDEAVDALAALGLVDADGLHGRVSLSHR